MNNNMGYKSKTFKISMRCYMRLSGLFNIILCMMLVIGCSGETKFLFQDNDPEPPYKLFDLLDDYPALYDAFSEIDQHTFNQLLADTLNNNIDAFEDILQVSLEQNVLPDKITDLLVVVLPLMERIMHQDNYDDPEDTYNYSQDFYSFLDDLSVTGTGASSEVVDIMGKVIGYIFVAHGSEIDTVMNDLNEFLTQTDGQCLQSTLPLINEAMGKILLRSDQYIEYNGENIELGNTVRGVDALLSGINVIATKDIYARESLYELIRELGNVLTAKVGDKDFARVLKDLMTNIAEFATEGGLMMANNNYYNNDSNYYVNMELRNGIREALPAIMSLFIQAKGEWEDGSDYSIIYDPKGRSPLDILTQQLYNLKINCDIDFENYGVGDTLKQMVMYNGYGQLRSDASYKLSYLDHLLFTLVVSNDFGFKTYLGYHENEPYRNGIQQDTDCLIHSHGKPTGGILTLNDCLYSMTAGAKYVYQYDLVKEYLGAYELSLDPSVSNYRYSTKSGRTDQAKYVFRSSFNFSSNDVESSSKYKYYMGYDFPALLLMSGFTAGDAGIPNGGYTGIHPDTDTTGIDESNNDYRTYYPYVGNGLGELNTGAWVMGWIARACWEGEGPYYSAPSTPYTKLIDGKLYYIYFRPDGRIYALVWKPNENDPNTWEYFYPYEGGNDVKGTKTIGSGSNTYYERLNHYYESWETDKYILKAEYANNEQKTRYYTLKRVVGNQGIDKYLLHKINVANNPNDDVDAGVESGLPAGGFTIKELVAEKSIKRECKSQEEALFRNFQWLMLEKKIVCIMPMRSYVHVHAGDIHIDPLAVAVLEANGVLGMSNLKKGTTVGSWAIKGDEGLEYNGCAGKDIYGNNVNYGNSYLPGDGRIILLVKEDAAYLAGAVGDSVTINTIWNEILGSSSATPAILSKNLEPIGKMAFLLSPTAISSDSADIGSPLSTIWQDRNKLLPVVVALAGSLHSSSYYKVPDDENDYWYNFNEKDKHKYPLRKLRDLLALLANPYFKYYKQFYSDGGENIALWVPQIANEGGKGSFAYLSPEIAGYENVDYRPRQDLRSFAQLLIENTNNNKAACDGLLPLIANTKLVSKLLAFLQKIGNNEGVYADTDAQSDEIMQWGARRRIFYGLEQIVTSIKASKGYAYEQGYTNSSYPEWMFTKRPEDIDLDIALDEIIGSDTLDKGLALFVDHRNPNHVNYIDGYTWNNYYKLMWGIGELMSTKGFTNGKYCLTEDVIDLIDNTLTKFEATDKQLTALRHTLGMLFTYYDKESNSWVNAQELTVLLTQKLPQLMQCYDGHYLNLLQIASILLEDDGFADYFISTLHSDYPSQQIFEELYSFLSNDDPIVGISNPNSLLWKDLQELLVAFLELMDAADHNRCYVVDYDNFTSKYFSSKAEYLYSEEFDPYSALGWVLSK